MSISKYVESKNRWAAIFGQPELDLRSAADRKKIAASIDADLSPENLTCDGELSGLQVRAKYQLLIKAAQDLVRLDPTITFQEFVQ